MKEIVVALVTSLFLIGLGSVALAHSNLVSTVPAAGSTVATAPASVTLTFSEELGTGTLGIVQDAKGATVSTGSSVAGADHKQIAIALRAGLANGAYKVTYMAMAADDGDMTEGSFAFTVGVAVAAPAPAAPVGVVPALPNTSTEVGREPAALGLLALAAAIAAISVTLFRARGTQG